MTDDLADSDKVKLIFDALYKSETIVESLYLGGCKINDDGAELIAEYLHAGATLKNLDLSVNDIGNKGAILLANAVQSGVRLESLNLRVNPIWRDGYAALKDAQRFTTTIIRLSPVS